MTLALEAQSYPLDHQGHPSPVFIPTLQHLGTRMLAISISHKKDVKLWKVGSPAHGHKARPGAGMELVPGACCPQNP